MSRVGNGGFPDPGQAVGRPALDALIASLGPWLDDRGQRLVSLDERLTVAGSQTDRSDLAIAFVVWQAARERRDELAAVSWPDRDATSTLVAEVSHRPLVDAAGSVLAASLPEGVHVVDALVTRLESTLARTEAATESLVAAQRSITDDLAVAAGLAERLGDQVRTVADLRRELSALHATSADPGLADTALERIGRAAAQVRRDLEALDADRRSLLAACAAAGARLDGLRAREVAAQEAARQCRDRIADPPRLAVPAVDAVAVPPADLADRPWAAARPIAEAFVRTVDRLDRAFDAVIEAYTAPRRERDDLRGLLQAYRDKADDLGAAERPDLDAAYRVARTVLWSAPCDLAAARAATADYQQRVLALSAPLADRAAEEAT